MHYELLEAIDAHIWFSFSVITCVTSLFFIYCYETLSYCFHYFYYGGVEHLAFHCRLQVDSVPCKTFESLVP